MLESGNPNSNLDNSTTSRALARRRYDVHYNARLTFLHDLDGLVEHRTKFIRLRSRTEAFHA